MLEFRMPQTIRACMQRWANLSKSNSAYLCQLSSHCSTLWHLVQLHSHKIGAHALQCRLCFDAERTSGPAEYHNLHGVCGVSMVPQTLLVVCRLQQMTGINDATSGSRI